MFLHSDSEDSDQTGRMPRLICVFTGHTDHFVGFVMWWLKWLSLLHLVCSYHVVIPVVKTAMPGSVYHLTGARRKSTSAVNVVDRSGRQFVKIGKQSRPSYCAMMCVPKKNRKSNRYCLFLPVIIEVLLKWNFGNISWMPLSITS